MTKWTIKSRTADDRCWHSDGTEYDWQTARNVAAIMARYFGCITRLTPAH